MLRITMTGGGSGGHIYPLIAVAAELQKIASAQNYSIDITYIGASGEFKSALEQSGIRTYKISGGKLRNYSSVMNFFDVFRVIFAFIQALYRLLILMPDAVFSKGGPGALPVVAAARVYRIPVLVHDSDAVPGRTTSASARFAARIAVSFEKAAPFFKGKNVALTGNPVRGDLLLNPASGEAAKQSLGFAAAPPLMLILGSSQGAVRINDFILDNLHILLQKFQLLHQVGRNNYDEAMKQRAFLLEKLPAEFQNKYKIVPFFENDYKTAFAAADIVVSRASSGAIFEIAAFGKPSILIPLPEAAQDHQRENAYAYAETGAAIVIEQENLLPNLFMEQVEKIMGNEEARNSMSKAAFSFAKPDAGRVIAEELVRLCPRAS